MTNYFHERKEYLSRLLEKNKNEVKALPAGTLVMYDHGKKWYRQEKSKKGGYVRTYIQKKDEELAALLARKTLLVNSITDAENELAAIDAYLKTRKPGKLKNIEAPTSAYITLLKPEFPWLADDDYPRNQNHPEALTIKAPKGQFVRSKSEAIIAYSLYENHLQYRYECGLEICDVMVYPDFTIKHPLTGKVFIWEHFGLADQPSYQNNMCSKIRNYINAGYVPGDNLILTYETKDCPLDISYVQGVINLYFGPLEN
ncbi:hypothetical protein [Butyrivibrio sp. INlla16]|uniref:hypothetical protein n=1 Tax=Butyrivibrio sp. INlla16 TaxID=1520807 RepID=UPI0008835C98|nr:hypothetical protein [Butyrivibrio sp. INlla16]SDB35939.1 hypothetical protein SAMN02910263_01730 [Butyrivibrio sp. INlla16]